jgi:acetyl esterase/lipase
VRDQIGPAAPARCTGCHRHRAKRGTAHTGDDALRDDAVRMADKLRVAGCHVELEVWPHMWHVWHMLMRVMPEAKAAFVRIAEFMQNKL